MQIYTKEELINQFRAVSEMGWVLNGRFGNHGGIGNTLEDFLGITENNLPIPNAAEWELKTQNRKTISLTTLFHVEPSPRAIRFVPRVLLPFYGWAHKEAGAKYDGEEVSFRQTINGLTHSDRGFIVKIDREVRKVLVSFDESKVSSKHSEWLADVERKIGLGELSPQPYWGFDDLEYKAGTKLLNCFYVQADVKKEDGKIYFWYNKVTMLQKFKFEGLLEALETGVVFVDFDARSGHNHGTKFRLKQNFQHLLYENITPII